LRLNRKLDEKFILLLCEFLDAVSRGEAADADESERMEPKDGESAPFSKTGLLLSTGHDIATRDSSTSFVLPLKSCMLAPGVREYRRSEEIWCGGTVRDRQGTELRPRIINGSPAVQCVNFRVQQEARSFSWGSEGCSP
jgi:hypothetical protein